MADKKSVKKPAVKAGVKKAATATAKPAPKPVAAPQKKPAALAPKIPEVRREVKPAVGAPEASKMKFVVGPTARNCPLVLDGEVAASDFSDTDCLTCGEFDCKFCESQGGSGSLRSRLFAGSEDGDDEGDDELDLDFGEGEESLGEEEGEDEEEL